MTTHIFLADDHPIVRQGIKSLLESEANFEIVGEADNGLQALREIELLKPDVAILDIMMPDLSGLEITSIIKKRSLPVRVIIMSMYSDEAYVKAAFKSGAYGYIIKQSPPATLLQAVTQVAQGVRYLCPPLTERVIQAYVQKIESEESNNEDEYDQLTSRERELFHLVAQGIGNAEIAQKLNISSRTVEVHRSNMMKKLGLTTQYDLILYAMRRGFIKLDS
jgi:DNA-binding NarL/FixJ family response regulator